MWICRVEEVETPALLEAWNKTLCLMRALQPRKLIPGHMESGWELKADEDLAHTQRYLDRSRDKIAYAPKQATVQELFDYFKNEFPQRKDNLDFFLGHLSNQYGEGSQKWEEDRYHNVTARTVEGLKGYWFK
ncbi:hypothetical protein BDW69DRAFT_188512 [Aspergillus filifer]